MKTSEVIKLNDTQFEQQLNAYDAIPKSRVLTKTEEHELNVRVAEFSHTLKKCSTSNIVSHELQPIVDEFESANYNLNNLKPNIKVTLNSTYEDLKSVIEDDPKAFKGTSAKLYCDLYEMFKMNKAAEAMNRMKSSKFFKSSKLSRESYSVESLEVYLAETNGELSTEGFVTNFFTKLLHKSQVPAAANSVQWAAILVSVLLMLITTAVIALCIISAQYKIELAKILDKLADDDIKTKGALKTHKDNIKAAALAVEENTHNVTKMTVFKAAKYSIRQIEKFSKANYAELDKSTEEFNRECNEIVTRSIEAAGAASVVGATATKAADAAGNQLMKKFTEFVTNNKKGIIAVCTIAMIIGLIKVGIPILRAAIYHFKSWRINVSNFFNEQTELTEVNIEYLIEQRDNPATSDMERKRLDKIISKQKIWVKNMSAWANMFYKSEVDAASDTMYDVREDEKIDFDKQASEAETAEEKSIVEIESSTVEPEGTTIDEINTTPSNKPVVLF